MLAIYHHHGPVIKTSGNLSALKKIAYAAALCFSLLHYRGFISGLGFASSFSVCNSLFRDFIENIKPLVQEEVPMKMIRDYLQESILGGTVVDTFDRRKVRSLIFSVFAPDLMDEGFQFCRELGEAELWQIPHDGSLNSYVTWAQRLPNTPYCDGLLMARNCSGPIRDWNLSRWIAKGLCKLDTKPYVSRSHMQVVPDSIPLFAAESLVMAVLKGEVDEFNSVLEKARNHGNLKNRYLVYLNEKHGFLFKCVREKQLVVVDCRLFSNIRGLLSAFLIQNLEILMLEQAGLDFVLLGEEEDEGGMPTSGILILRGLSLICGTMENGKLVVNRRAMTVEPFPDVMVCVGRSSTTKPERFMCPLFRTVNIGKEKNEYIDGQAVNFLWHIPLDTEQTQIELVANGTCLVCELPGPWDQPA
jgi:hypothetical protein